MFTCLDVHMFRLLTKRISAISWWFLLSCFKNFCEEVFFCLNFKIILREHPLYSPDFSCATFISFLNRKFISRLRSELAEDIQRNTTALHPIKKIKDLAVFRRMKSLLEKVFWMAWRPFWKESLIHRSFFSL